MGTQEKGEGKALCYHIVPYTRTCMLVIVDSNGMRELIGQIFLDFLSGRYSIQLIFNVEIWCCERDCII